MKICLIEAPFDWTDRVTRKTPSYGFERIASLLRCKIYYADMTLADYTIENLPKSDFYAFSVMQPNIKSSFKLIKKIKEKYPNSKVIIGGPSVADSFGSILKEGGDIAVLGFGEHSFKEIIKGKDLNDIANIFYWKNDEIISSKREYPPKSWDKIMPRKILPIKSSEYMNHAMILGSLGCGYACNFCNIIKQQPRLYERDDKYIIKEIKLRVKEKGNLSIQILHQNFSKRLPLFMQKLKKEKLLGNILSLAFNTRLDTFEIHDIERALSYGLPIILYTGVENFDDNMLKRLNKGYNGDIAKSKLLEIIQLEKQYDNFDFIMTFIGFDKYSTKEELIHNLKIMKELFIEKNCVKPIHHFFSSGLRRPNSEDLYEYPLGELGDILKRYKKISEKLPPYSDRRELYFRKVLEGVNLPYLVWAEFMIMESLIYGKDPEYILNKFNI